MLDDHGVLLDKEPGWSSLAKALDYNDEGHVFFRPVTNLFRLALIAAIPKDPAYYHLVNIVLFGIHLSLIFLVIRKLSGRPQVAFLTSVLYALHPVNATFVNYITGHEVLLYGIFLDMAALSFLGSFGAGNPRGPQIAGVCFFMIALLTQEISIGFLFFIFIVTFGWWGKLSPAEGIRTCLPYCLAALVYAFWRILAVSHTADTIERMIVYSDKLGVNTITYVNTVLDLIGWYLRQLFACDQWLLIKTMPGQNEDLVWNFFVLFVVFLMIALLFRHRGMRDLVTVSMLWFLSGFIPLFGLALIYPYAGFIIEPHWFFFSSIGFFFLMAVLCDQLLRGSRSLAVRSLVFLLVGGAVIFWFSKTQTYNGLMRSQESYCRYWLTIDPDFYFPNFWLARDLVSQNKLDEAEEHFKKALIGRKNDWLVYAGLGDIEFLRCDKLKARDYYNQALRLNPRSVFLKKNVDWLEQYLRSDKVTR